MYTACSHLCWRKKRLFTLIVTFVMRNGKLLEGFTQKIVTCGLWNWRLSGEKICFALYLYLFECII